MNLHGAARRHGYLLRTSRNDPDKFWLVDAETGKLASPITGETRAQIEAAIRAIPPREGTATTARRARIIAGER